MVLAIIDSYFVFHSTDYVFIQGKGWCYHYEAFPVNEFGHYIIDTENSDDTMEISTVPVPIDEAEFKCAFLYFSNGNGDEIQTSEVGDTIEDWNESWEENMKEQQPLIFQAIGNGDVSSKAEYFDRLNLGFWEGFQPYHTDIGIRPITTNIVICDYFKYMEFPDFSLRLNHGFSRGFEEYRSMELKHLYKFSFLSDILPSARATFFIKGKRYVCSKLRHHSRPRVCLS